MDEVGLAVEGSTDRYEPLAVHGGQGCSSACCVPGRRQAAELHPLLHCPTVSSPGGVRLFCVPHAGAGISAFRGWTEALGPAIETILVQLPGRESRFRHAAYLAISDLVNDLASAVLALLEPESRYAFFGNSFGGLVAFEAVKEIERRSGRAPEHLFVSACGAPHLPLHLPPISHLADDALLRELLGRYDGIPAPLLRDREFLAALLPVLRADLSILETYSRVAPVPLACPVTAFGGDQDHTVTRGQVDAWQVQTTGPFTRVHLEEGHLFLQTRRQLLTRHIQEALLPEATAGHMAQEAR